MLKAENISKTYGNKKEALSKVSFDIRRNEITAIVGPNGAGKSTLLRILAGVNSQTQGQVHLEEGVRVGAVFDGNGLYLQLTAYENMSFFYRLNKQNPPENETETICGLLKSMDLYEVRNDRVKEYSKGMARKLAIARALLTNPDILLMDEPFDGLDITSHAFLGAFLKTWVKDRNHSVVFSSHNMADVEKLCDRVLMIKKGHLMNNLSMVDLNKKVTDRYKIVVREKIEDFPAILGSYEKCEQSGDSSIISESGVGTANLVLDTLKRKGYTIMEFSPVYNSLEDIYLAEVGGAE